MPTLVELWLGRGKGAIEKIPLIVPILTFYFFILVFQLTLPVESTYVLLLVVGVLTLIVYDLLTLRRINRRKEVISRMNARLGIPRDERFEPHWRSSLDIPNYTIATAIVPILLGVAVVGVPFLVYVFVTGKGLESVALTTSDFVRVFTTEVLVVAVTEEFYFRFALPKIYGGLPPQLLFAISHPLVRALLLAGNPASAIVPFFYFFLFGLGFQQIVFMGQASDVPEKYRRYFGLPLANGIHGMLNTIFILFPSLEILGVVPQPFQVFATSYSSPVALLPLLAFLGALVYASTRLRRRGRSRGLRVEGANYGKAQAIRT